MVQLSSAPAQEELHTFFLRVIADPSLHATWLNALSFLENCGARAIAHCEHPTLVPKELLKHAAEEFRHAYFFKAQIQKVYPPGLPDYRFASMLGGIQTYHFFTRLHLTICRYLKEEWALRGDSLREHAYLLVTYAIEKRAEEIYPAYQEALRAQNQPLSIVGIIRDEAHHLQEIEEGLPQLCSPEEMAHRVLEIEKELFSFLWTQLTHLLRLI